VGLRQPSEAHKGPPTARDTDCTRRLSGTLQSPAALRRRFCRISTVPFWSSDRWNNALYLAAIALNQGGQFQILPSVATGSSTVKPRPDGRQFTMVHQDQWYKCF